MLATERIQPTRMWFSALQFSMRMFGMSKGMSSSPCARSIPEAYG